MTVTVLESGKEESPPSDAELIQQCLRGESTAFRDLYRRYQRQIRATLYQLCGSDSLDDLVQEVFLRAWKGLPRFRQAAQFSTWLYRIAWNVASDRRRQISQQRSHLQPSNRFEDVPDPATSGLMHLHYQDVVQRGLQHLSLEHRAVLVLHDLADLPQSEVASILAVPLGTVKSRLHHARTAMRQLLQQEGVQL